MRWGGDSRLGKGNRVMFAFEKWPETFNVVSEDGKEFEKKPEIIQGGGTIHEVDKYKHSDNLPSGYYIKTDFYGIDERYTLWLPNTRVWAYDE